MIEKIIQYGKVLFLILLVQPSYAETVDAPKVYKFDFGSGKVASGYVAVNHKSIYGCDKDYGFICESEIITKSRSGRNVLTRDFITSDAPILFMLKIPTGRYKVTVTLGDPKGESETTIKAESRRLMLENVKTKYGEVVTKTFIVDVRSPLLNEYKQIWLNARETRFLNWDNCITLEFNGACPCVSSVKIEPAGDLPALLLTGDSTVTDQEYEPWAAWGQMITRFFNSQIVVANYAQSGETLKSFREEGRLDKVLKELHQGDYVMIQFGTNDKVPGKYHVEPFSGYKEQLKYYIDTIRSKGGKPILVTPIHSRSFTEEGEVVNERGEYPLAMRETAKEEQVPLIDLHLMSEKLFKTLGPEGAKNAFVVYPANTFSGQENPLSDAVHQNSYGAYELAKCIIQWIKDHDMELSSYVLDDFSTFNPYSPDCFDDYRIPLSPSINLNKPLQR